jgi:hypothetical protein
MKIFGFWYEIKLLLGEAKKERISQLFIRLPLNQSILIQ